MEVFRTDISEKKEFKYVGDTIKQCEYNEQTGLYLYERYLPNGRLLGYEMVKPVKYKNPDGSIVGSYPSSEQFGRYGWFYSARSNRDKLIEALSIVDNRERNLFIHKEAQQF